MAQTFRGGLDMPLIIFILSVIGAVVVLGIGLSIVACLFRIIFGLLFIGLAVFSVIWLLTAVLSVF